MATPLRLSTDRRVDGTILLRAVGELDLSNIGAFTDAIAAALNGDKTMLTIDLGRVEYLDSGAINVLFGHAGHIRAVIANPILLPVLKISGLTDVLPVEAASAGE